MKTIKICFVHPFYKSVQDLANHLLIPQKYNLVYDDKNPDYIIASEWIYKNKKYYQEFLSLRNDKTINIFLAGEAMAPDLNIFDYAVIFDRDLQCGDRITRMPTIDFFRKRLTPDFFQPCSDAENELKQKTKFCNFIYTNANAHPRRDELFFKLSQYKRVDALGTHLRNVELSEKYVDEKLKRNYKFTIACENATYRGYTSEKLLTAMQAYTVPVYWGDPSVAESFNPKRFINANDMTLDQVLETVRKIDNDDNLWCEMVSQPVMTKQQEQKYKSEHKAYLDFWTNIFDSDLNKAKRIGQGTYPKMYNDFISNLVCGHNSKTKKYLFGIITKKTDKQKHVIRLLLIKLFSYTSTVK